MRPCQRRYAATIRPSWLGVEAEVGERHIVRLAVALDAGGQTGARVRPGVNHDDFDYDAREASTSPEAIQRLVEGCGRFGMIVPPEVLQQLAG